MVTILHIDSSARNFEQSFSRQYSAKLITFIKDKYPEAKIITRDVARNPISHLNSDWQNSANQLHPLPNPTTQKEALKVSDELIAELESSDILVLGVPMYNFTISATLKIYLDQIIRSGKTFEGYNGLLKNKKAYIIETRGGGKYEEGESNQKYNFQTPYLKCVFNFIGISDLQFIFIDGLSNPKQEMIDLSLQKAEQDLLKLII